MSLRVHRIELLHLAPEKAARVRLGVLLGIRLPNTSLRYSLDECKTWSENVLIDDVIGAYPSMVNLNDGTVLIVYYEEGGGSNIRAKRLKVDKTGVEILPYEAEIIKVIK